MAIRLSTGAAAAMLNVTGLKGALADGIIDVFTGNQPSDANNAATGTHLMRITLSAGAFTPGVATNGLEFDTTTTNTLSKAAAETWQGAGVADGTAGWARFYANATAPVTPGSDTLSTTAVRVDFSVGVTTGDITISPTTTIETSAVYTMDTCTITLPKSA